jgi:hypothetical protein
MRLELITLQKIEGRMVSKRFVTRIIKGAEWHFYLESASVYKRKHGSDSDAITYIKEREVYFNRADFDTNCVRHELFHIYIAESNTNSSPDFTKDDMEDLGAEIIGEFGPLIVHEADFIHNKLLVLNKK